MKKITFTQTPLLIFASLSILGLSACNGTPITTADIAKPSSKSKHSYRTSTTTKQVKNTAKKMTEQKTNAIKQEVVQQAEITPSPAPAPSSIPAWRRPASYTMTRGSHDAIFLAAKNNNMKMLKQMIADGTEVEHRNFNGETALHVAASLGNLGMVQYLIGKGADVNAETTKKWLPIHHAVRFERINVVNFLIAKGATLNAPTSDGLTALDFAKTAKNPAIKALAK